jgi:hypothetical protein
MSGQNTKTIAPQGREPPSNCPRCEEFNLENLELYDYPDVYDLEQGDNYADIGQDPDLNSLPLYTPDKVYLKQEIDYVGFEPGMMPDKMFKNRGKYRVAGGWAEGLHAWLSTQYQCKDTFLDWNNVFFQTQTTVMTKQEWELPTAGWATIDVKAMAENLEV